MSTKIDEADLAANKKLYDAILRMRTTTDQNIPSQVISAFLAVGMNENHTLGEIADALGTNVSTASRQLLDLGDRNRKMEPGYQLINRASDPMNLRVNRYTLTNKGKLLFREMAAIIRG